MTKETGNLIITITIVVAVLVCVALFIYMVKVEIPKEKEKERIRRQKLEEEYEKEPEYVFTQAKVVTMRKYVYHKMDFAMPMLPRQVDEYYVTFLTEDGEEKEYPVSEEFFFDVVKGEEGTLITVNGNFFDFGEGIDVVADEPTDAEENIEDNVEE